MPYIINGTELSLQPTSGKWVDRPILGFSGNGHPEYPSVREFEIRWQLSLPADANEVYELYRQLDVTGTATVSLPRYKYSSYEFREYSGTTLGEPSSNEYFNQTETEITLIIYGIVTE